MTPEDATRVIELLTNADNTCPTCYGSLTRDAHRLFPEVDWYAAAERLTDDETRWWAMDNMVPKPRPCGSESRYERI